MSDILPGYPDFKSEPERHPTPIDMAVDRSYNAQHVTEMARTGQFLINGDRLRILHDLGCAAEQLGSLRILKGSTVISIDGLTRAITAAQSVVDDDSDKYTLKQRMECAKLLGYLANNLSKVTTGAVKIDRDVAEVVIAQDERRRQSFQPGQAVALPPKPVQPTIQV